MERNGHASGGQGPRDGRRGIGASRSVEKRPTGLDRTEQMVKNAVGAAAAGRAGAIRASVRLAKEVAARWRGQKETQP